ncbi:MAG: Stk1 family PASTA domain-containing Ser/Thr kinase [Acidobacteria bacterium]|nr:Stk1 family PASTA domain-containing Ser/Thr kinase [Acidobacteriota bacterium]
MSQQGPTIFGGRYELQRQLARGGMADVFLARDQTLDREVAVKVLFAEFASNPAFVERFRREAQAAATLTHPNVVGVYDWGEENDTYFIVMEYVEGRALSEILRTEGPIHPDRAAEIAIDVSMALDAAHRQGLVHRDVKPGNVLVSPTGEVKVADFGIATAIAAGTDNDLTQAGQVMGTATYFSPEQAQGHKVDQRSDIYSLGIVLYEMLTGKPPFTGDTPLSVAYKHVQEKPRPLSELGVNIAPSLEAIMMKAMAKDPERRYSGAAKLASDLRRYREGQHDLAPGAAAAGVAAGAAIAASGPEDQLTTVSPAAVGAVTPAGGYPQAAGPPSGTYYTVPPRDDGWRRSAVFAVSFVVLIAVLIGLLLALRATLVGGDDEPSVEQVELERVTDLPLEEAQRILEADGLVVVPRFEENANVPENNVFRQNPEAGTFVDIDSEVVLTVSKPSGEFELVSQIGKDSTAARDFLAEQDLIVTITTRVDPDKPIGQVIDMNPPPGTKVKAGDSVELIVSEGPGTCTVPSVVGQPSSDAIEAVVRADFEQQVDEEGSSSVEEGTVIRTDPPANTPLSCGAPVTIVVSSGIPQVLVPSVEGLQADSATATITAEGLVPVVVKVDVPETSPNVGRVISQSPGAGVSVATGSEVTIEVGNPIPVTTTTKKPPKTTTTQAPVTQPPSPPNT